MQYTNEQLIAAVKTHGGNRPAAKALGIAESSIRRRLNGVATPPVATKVEKTIGAVSTVVAPAAPVVHTGYLNLYRDRARGFRTGKLRTSAAACVGKKGNGRPPLGRISFTFTEGQFDE